MLIRRKRYMDLFVEMLRMFEVVRSTCGQRCQSPQSGAWYVLDIHKVHICCAVCFSDVPYNLSYRRHGVWIIYTHPHTRMHTHMVVCKYKCMFIHTLEAWSTY